MKSFFFSFLFIALTGTLLIREQASGTFGRLDARILKALEVRQLPKNPVVTMVRHNEQSADISGSAELTEMDMALFLRTALKFSASSIGIAGDMAGKSGNPLAMDILSIQTHGNAHVYFGLQFSMNAEHSLPYFKPTGRVNPDANMPFRFSGISIPLELPKNATIGFLNVDEKSARNNLIPVLASYRDIAIPSFALAGLLASHTIPDAMMVTSDMEFPTANGGLVKINPSGFFRIQESAEVLIESVTLDELLLEMEKQESGKPSAMLDTLLSNRIILLGRDNEADRTIALASGKKYSPLHVQALTMASFIAGRTFTQISCYWNLLMLLPVALALLLIRNETFFVQFLLALFLLLLPIAVAACMHSYSLWLPPLPGLGMAIAFILAAFFLIARPHPSQAVLK